MEEQELEEKIIDVLSDLPIAIRIYRLSGARYQWEVLTRGGYASNFLLAITASLTALIQELASEHMTAHYPQLPINSLAQVIGGHIEVQIAGGRKKNLFLTSEEDAEKQVSLTMLDTLLLLGWLEARKRAIHQQAQLEESYAE